MNISEWTTREWSAVSVVLVSMVGTAWYIYQVFTNPKMKPVLASWLVMGGTMVLSLVTYLTSPDYSLVSNAANTCGVFNILAIMSVVAYTNFRRRQRVEFNEFQKWCLTLAGVIAAFWIMWVWGWCGTGTIPNILAQILMIIGYIATIQKLWSAEGNTEPLLTWWCITIASAIGIYVARVSQDQLALVYSIRATVTTVIVILLAYRAELRGQFCRTIVVGTLSAGLQAQERQRSASVLNQS